jgi:hypothetical protein
MIIIRPSPGHKRLGRAASGYPDGATPRALATVLTDALTLAGWQSLDRGEVGRACDHYRRACDAALRPPRRPRACTTRTRGRCSLAGQSSPARRKGCAHRCTVDSSTPSRVAIRGQVQPRRCSSAGRAGEPDPPTAPIRRPRVRVRMGPGARPRAVTAAGLDGWALRCAVPGHRGAPLARQPAGRRAVVRSDTQGQRGPHPALTQQLPPFAPLHARVCPCTAAEPIERGLHRGLRFRERLRRNRSARLRALRRQAAARAVGVGPVTMSS